MNRSFFVRYAVKSVIVSSVSSNMVNVVSSNT